jgi:O-antigen/teichoic acid export membrane protein
MREAFAKYRPLVARSLPGVWALADQAAVSLGSFLLILILTRRLAPPEFGLYTLVYSALLMVNAVHNQLAIYPMVVVVARSGEEDAAELTGLSLAVTAGFSALLAPLLGGFLLVIAGPATAAAATALAPIWQLQETLRRAHMARCDHRRALLGDAVSYLLPPLLALLLIREDRLNPCTALCAMGVAFALGAAAQARALRIALPSLTRLRAWIVECWRLGGWLLFTTLVNFGNMQVLPWLLAYWHGLASTAAMRALVNPVTLCHPLMFAMGNLVIPVVAGARARLPDAAAGRLGVRTGIGLAAPAVPYFLLLAAFPKPALRLLYGSGAPYLAEAGGVRLVVLCYSAMLVAVAFEATLKGLERTRQICAAQFIAVAATLLVGVPLTWAFGLMGALAGSCVAMMALLCAYFCMIVLRRGEWGREARLRTPPVGAVREGVE